MQAGAKRGGGRSLAQLNNDIYDTASKLIGDLSERASAGFVEGAQRKTPEHEMKQTAPVHEVKQTAPVPEMKHAAPVPDREPTAPEPELKQADERKDGTEEEKKKADERKDGTKEEKKKADERKDGRKEEKKKEGQKSVPAFSIAMIVKNAAETLETLLKQFAEFVDRGGDLVVVDTGSTDDTTKIARACGARVIEVGAKFVVTLNESMIDQINQKYDEPGMRPLISKAKKIKGKTGVAFFNFGAAREFAGQQAKTDVVLQPDGSDVFEAFDLDYIDGIIKRMKMEEILAGERDNKFTIHGHYLQKYRSEKSKDYSVLTIDRLYDRRVNTWVGSAHECLSVRDSKHRPSNHYEKAVVFPEEKLLNVHFKKEKDRKHYIIGLAYDAFTRPNDGRIGFYFGRDLMSEGRYESAKRQFQHVYQNEKAWTVHRNQAACKYAEILLEQKKPKEAREWFWKAYEVSPTRREPLIRLAETSVRTKKWEHCFHYAKLSLLIVPEQKNTEPDAYYGALPHELCLRALVEMGKQMELRTPHLRALRELNSDPESRSQSAAAAISAGERTSAPTTWACLCTLKKHKQRVLYVRHHPLQEDMCVACGMERPVKPPHTSDEKEDGEDEDGEIIGMEELDVDSDDD